MGALNDPAAFGKELDRKLLARLLEIKPDFILLDWGYSAIVSDQEKEERWFSVNSPQAIDLKKTANDLLFGAGNIPVLGPIGEYLKVCETDWPDLLIYTYNPFDEHVFETLSNTQAIVQEEYKKKVVLGAGERSRMVLQYIETSAYFNKPRSIGLYKGWYSQEVEDDLREIGTERQLVEYGRFLSEAFLDYLSGKNGQDGANQKGPRVFDLENLRFVRYKRLVSDKLGCVSFIRPTGITDTINLRLGALTFYGDSGKILIDVPQKEYFRKLDDFAKDTSILSMLHSRQGDERFWSYPKSNYLYLRIYPKLSNKELRRGKGLLDLSIAAYHSSRIFSSEADLKNLASLLFSAVFYHCDSDKEGNWTPGSDEVELRSGPALRKWRESRLAPIDLFFLCQPVSIREDKEGWVNYTFYNDAKDVGALSVKEIEQIVKRLVYDVRPVILAKAKDALLPQFLDEIRKEAMRAGVSRVMARNLSHNLGSHVLTALTHPQQFLDRAKVNATPKSTGHNHHVTINLDKNGSEVKFYLNEDPNSIDEQLSRFNRYLRTRMDLLAEMAVGPAPFFSGRMVKEDVLKPFHDVRLVRDEITGNGGKGFAPDFDFAGNDVCCSFPSDEQGVQCLNLIVEDLARNGSKHGAHKADDMIHLCFEFAEANGHDEFISLLVHDKNDSRPAVDLNTLVLEQNDRIRRKMLLPDGEVRPDSWGMLEMKIAAAYLRGIDPADIDDEAYQPASADDVPNGTTKSRAHLALLTAEPQWNEPKKETGSLAYRLFLRRHMDLLVVVPDQKGNDSPVRHFATGVTIAQVSAVASAKKAWSHRLMVCATDVKAPEGKHLPRRIVTCDVEDFLKDPTDAAKTKALGELVWQTYRAKVLGSVGLKVIKSDQAPNGTSNCRVISTGTESKEAQYICHAKNMGTGFFEVFSSASPLFRACGELFGTGVAAERSKTHFAEAFMVPIAILDERIQKSAYQLNEPAIKDTPNYATLLKHVGVSIPDPSAEKYNLNGSDISVHRTDIEEWIKSELKNDGYLVIHMGVLERMTKLGNEKDNAKEAKVSEWLEGIGKAAPNWTIIFTSGRARPAHLPASEYFLPYSLLARYTLEQRSKYHLTQLLFDCRAITNTEKG